MEAIVLAGGMGTRLRQVVSDLPKPMAPIAGHPFLAYLLTYLNSHGIAKIIMSTGYMCEKIESYFGNRYKNLDIMYSREDEPLGTGGAIRQAFNYVQGDHIIIVNGDTFFNISMNTMLEKHIDFRGKLTMALKPMKNCMRYGTVSNLHGRVTGFLEKKDILSGDINGGVYIAQSHLFMNMLLPKKFSFETDFLSKIINQMPIFAYLSDSYFIDIGIPEDYRRAQIELEQIIRVDSKQ